MLDKRPAANNNDDDEDEDGGQGKNEKKGPMNQDLWLLNLFFKGCALVW